MAGGRRTAKSNAFKHHSHTVDDRHACEIPTPQQATPPKHIPIPDLPVSSELSFELDIFVFSLLAMGGQYINLYRSVFWLPYSNTEYALNFYLIDPYVLAFNMLIVGKKLPVCLLKQVCFFCFPVSIHSICTQCINVIVSTIVIPSLIWCSYNIFIHHGILSIFCLGYPSIVYVILFGPSISQLLELKNSMSECCTVTKPKSVLNKNTPFSVSHVCSMSAESVRDEVEALKTDFNQRLKQVLYNSLRVAYYLSFVPCCFAQNTLYYETYWVGQHIALTWLSCFTMHVNYYFPSGYCDILHRSALHLGRWQKIDMKNIHVPYNIWSETAMWNQGAHVKHAKEFFKAESIANAAEPGNPTHARFYTVFNNPSTPIGCLMLLQMALVGFQLFLLMTSYDWNHLFSIQFLMLINCKVLFKVLRDYLVLKKIYKEEKNLLLKFSS